MTKYVSVNTTNPHFVVGATFALVGFGVGAPTNASPLRFHQGNGIRRIINRVRSAPEYIIESTRNVPDNATYHGYLDFYHNGPIVWGPELPLAPLMIDGEPWQRIPGALLPFWFQLKPLTADEILPSGFEFDMYRAVNDEREQIESEILSPIAGGMRGSVEG